MTPPGVTPNCSQQQPSIQYCDIALIKFLNCSIAVETSVTKFPVVKLQPPVLVDPEDNTLEMLALNRATVPQNLPPEVEDLYANVAGDSILLSEEDARAIDYCVKTPGCPLYELLISKRSEFGGGDPNMVYIRTTIGPDLGNSPGSPFVMEIWPPGCYSPIHDHADCVAVIKVLHGTITSRYFNPLADRNNGEPVSFSHSNFSAGNVTFLTPNLFQTHQLVNMESTTCITIQSYNYPGSDEVHYETFDNVLPSEDFLHHFTPNSDYEYMELIQMVREEYAKSKGSSSSSSSSSLGAGAIAGIVVGAVFAVVVVAIGAVFAVRRCRNRTGHEPID